MTAEALETVEIDCSEQPRLSVIWLHGLGADGHDFEPIVPELAQSGYPMRFVFPHAPVRPVTLNGGMPMRAWFDILGLDRNSRQDEAGIRQSEEQVKALIVREVERGVAPGNIVLAGFSQGGAVALHTGLRYPERLAGIIGLSCYLPLESVFDDEALPVNADTPLFLAHGSLDPVVPAEFGEHSREFLAARSYDIQWHSYPMPHAVCPEEVSDLRAWLAARG